MIVVGQGFTASFLAKMTREFGAVYGPGGRVSYYRTQCGGIESDLLPAGSTYLTVGVYKSWAKLCGRSFVSSQSSQTPLRAVSFATSQVLSVDLENRGELVGTQSTLAAGAGVSSLIPGVNLIPFRAGADWCSTMLLQVSPDVEVCGEEAFRAGPPRKNCSAAESMRPGSNCDWVPSGGL